MAVPFEILLHELFSSWKIFSAYSVPVTSIVRLSGAYQSFSDSGSPNVFVVVVAMYTTLNLRFCHTHTTECESLLTRTPIPALREKISDSKYFRMAGPSENNFLNENFGNEKKANYSSTDN